MEGFVLWLNSNKDEPLQPVTVDTPFLASKTLSVAIATTDKLDFDPAKSNKAFAYFTEVFKRGIARG